MSIISRRECMTWAAAAGGLTVGGAYGAVVRHPKKHGRGHIHHHKHYDVAGSAPDSLNGLAHAKGLRFGSCLGTGPSNAPNWKDASGRAGSFNDPKMRALFVAQCGVLVPENELKWYALRKDPKSFDFSRADALIDFAEKYKVPVRGHTLLWNRGRWMLDWVKNYDFGPTPALTAEKMLTDHIKTVCGRYGERIFSYDVVNESIAPDTGEMEDSPFTKYLGPNVIDVCFHAARQAAPHAQLVYNDYMGWADKDATHRAAVLKLLERMKKNNVPIDALGIQAHIGSSAVGTATGLTGVNIAEWRKFLDEVTAMGIDLVITEFDINDKYLTGDIAERDRVVAEFGKNYLDIVLSYPQLRYLMAWGIVDKYSWLQSTSPRADGKPKRPAPYDSNFQPKPLRDAFVQAFAAAPSRPELIMKPA
jgi:endo-1,4-beta-xylanase